MPVSMKTFLIISVVLALFAVLGVYRLFIREPAELIRTTTAFERKTEGGTPRILIVGDSTGVGVGSSAPILSIAGRLGTTYLRAYIENRAVSGARTAEVAEQFKDTPVHSFDIVLIQVGANDVTHFTKPDELRGSVAALLSRGHEVGAHVFLMTSGSVGHAPLFIYPFSRIFTNRSLLVRDIFNEEADKAQAHYIDLYEPREDDIFLTDPKKYFAADSFHPSEEGYGVWYEQVKQALIAEKLLRQ